MSAATVAEMLDAAGAVDSRGITFLGEGTSRFLSYAELAGQTRELAARWAGFGARAGDRVLMVVVDEREFVLAFLSALRAGLVPVPVFPPFRAGDFDGYVQRLDRIREVSRASHCLISEMLRPLFGEPFGAPLITLDDVGNAPSGTPAAPEPEDLAFLQFTSGSTGEPKGVMVTHASLLANARSIATDGMAVDPERDRGVSWLPLYHDMGLIGFLIVPLLAGAGTWIMPPLRFARDPLLWLRTMSEVRATISFAPNFAYGLITRMAADESLAGLDLSSWRIAGCGAEPVRAETLRRFADRLAGAGFSPRAFMPSYGLAEATLAVSLTPVGAGLSTVAEVVSCGPPLPGTEVAVRGEAGGEGALWVRGPGLAAGYYRAPEATARVWRDGWLDTGDRGFLRDGELYVTGRTRDLIIVNGQNYHPQDIEWEVGRVPGVRLGNVVALPAAGGARIVMEVRKGADVDAVTKQVRRQVRRTIGITVDDVTVVPRSRIPKTSSGKLRRSHTAALLDSGALTAEVGES